MEETMNKEKMWGFLNLEPDSKSDKFSCWIAFGMSLFYTGVSVVSMWLATEAFYGPMFAYLGMDIIFLIPTLVNKNPVYDFLLLMYWWSMCWIRPFIAYILVAIYKNEPFFSLLHFLILALILWLTLYVVWRLYRGYRIILEHSIEEAQVLIRQKATTPKWIPIVSLVAGSPMLLIQLLRDPLATIGFGGSGILFLNSCAMFFLFSLFLFKCVIIIRYKAWRYYKQ